MPHTKWNILLIKDVESMFNYNIQVLEKLFNSIDIVLGREEALEYFNKFTYDIVISDLSVKPEEVAFLKQIQDIKPKQSLFAMVSPKDTDKLYGIADMGINAFELMPEQLDQALEQISLFDPYAEA